ncbi:MAG TPA: catalase family protein [Chloroflexia bacterium]|nr:catalase family protein [Chloroflexia bacterium]
MSIGTFINDSLVKVINAERRVDPYFRDGLDAVLKRPLEALAQAIIRRRLKDQGLALAEEKLLPDEARYGQGITECLAQFSHQHYKAGQHVERVGNSKTYGVVRAEFEVLPGLPAELRQGIFSQPRTYKAWVRFAGPGPLVPPDLDDNGILSIGIKLMGVAGEKIWDHEKWTQDFTGLSCPTFTTSDVASNLELQRQLIKGTPVFYFLTHPLDGLMQALYSRTQSNPLEVLYWSCTPYLYGEGRAVKFAIRPTSADKTPFPRHPSDNYLRAAMVDTLSRKAVTFDFMVQLQTDSRRMPIENAALRWPEKLSPFRTVAKLRIPSQKFDSPQQLAFADKLSYNPWHAIPEHRPLGNLNRARRAMYEYLSNLRLSMNHLPHVEPTGDEVFEDSAAGTSVTLS